MDVKPGYKQTDVGLIPEDWDERMLQDCAHNIVRGASPRPIDDPKWFDDQSSVGWLRISDVSSARRYLFETQQRLSEDGILHSRKVRAGELVMSICATVGRPVQTKIDVCIHDGFVHFGKLQISQDFLYYVLADLEPRWGEKGQTGSQMNLNTELIKATKIPVPSSLDEQEAIANFLSDLDAMLTSQDALIAKKRSIKQGAMQALLTGERRLPGCNEKWSVKQLGDILSIRHGRDQKFVISSSGHYPILATGGQIGWANRWLYDKPSVLIGRKGTIDQPQYMDTPFWTVDTLFYSELKGENIAKFFYYVFCLIDWSLYNEASGVPSLNAKTIESIEVRVPSTKEQAAITDVLTQMDNEIAALQSQRYKTAQLKQGMMQQLLTGRIRLI